MLQKDHTALRIAEALCKRKIRQQNTRTYIKVSSGSINGDTAAQSASAFASNA